MKVIICTRDLQFGGTGTHIRLLLKEFDRLDDIDRILIIGPNKLERFSSKTQFELLQPLGRNFIVRQPHFAIACKKRIEKILKKEKYDLIHTHHSFLAEDFKIPMITTMHTLNYFMMARNSKTTPAIKFANLFHRIYEVFDKQTIMNSSKVIFVSQNSMLQAAQRYATYYQRFIHIPNFIDVKFFYPFDETKKTLLREKYKLSLNSKYFLFVGRLEPLKGILSLIRAFEEFNKKYDSVELLFVGDGILRRYVSGFKFVKCLGKISYDRMNEIYNLADYFVLPSLYENFPIAVLEAMSCELPVIATDVGDVREIVNDNRMIIASPQAEDIIDKLEMLMSFSGQEIDKIRKANRKRVEEQYSCERNIPRVINIYKAIV